VNHFIAFFVKPSPHFLSTLLLLKELDAYQWLLLLASHSERHTLQILEVKADPNFPKK
jgi:hypothetical protein